MLMDGNMKRLTVFTPTYNREHLLGRLYDSLKAQTCDDFVWLIVDDGSTDNTKAVIDGYVQENKIDIRYIYRENGGKMRAHNDGVKNTETPFFLCVDSDDYLVSDAVESLLKTVDELSNKGLDITDKNSKIAGIITHKGRSESELLSGVNFPDKIERSTLYGLYLNGFKGETTIMFVTSVIAEYPFPEIEGEKYVPEDYIYDKIDTEYEYIVQDRIITVCEIVSEGYTDSVIKLKNNNPVAFYLYYEQRAEITPPSVLKIKYSGFYIKYAKKCGKSLSSVKLNPFYKMVGLLASVFINE